MFLRFLNNMNDRWKATRFCRRHGSYNFHQKDRKAFFYLPKASRAERGGGRLQGSAEGMVLITSTKKTERPFFICRRQAERSEEVEGYKVLPKAWFL